MTCPCPDVVSEASRESLPDDQLHAVYQHLKDCPDCWKDYLRARSDEPELTVPGYHIIKGLGHGVSSVVYKAWRISNPPELVALKLLWPANDDQRARFEREIAVLSRLRLPHIVKCRDSGRRGEMMYYAMDLIRGEALDEYFKNRASGIDEKLEVFERVCRALASAHAQGVAHRDLKPNNILVDDTGQPHILDFGLCTVDSNEWSTSVHQARTRPGDVMGTVKYMAPEQAWGGLLDGTIDYRADVWALGIMLYELATDGTYPYDTGPTDDKTAEDALLHRIRTETPKPARIASPTHALDLKRLIDRCLAWDRRLRIQSVTALAEDIGRCRAHAPIRTKSLPLRHRFQRITLGLAVRRRALLWLCSVAAVLLILTAFTRALNVRWLVRGYELAGRAPAHPFGAAPGDSRKDILIVSITQDAYPELKTYADDHGIHGVTSVPRSWRAVHGELMGRLARASPRAVAWDCFFKHAGPGRDAFVNGLVALHSAGIPAVLGVTTMDGPRPQSASGIFELVNDKCHFGILHSRELAQRAEIVLALRRGEDIWPSIALATFAATLHPDRAIGIDWHGREMQFELVYKEWGRPDSILRERHEIDLTSVYITERLEQGLRPGDVLGCRTFELQRPEKWRDHIVPYQEILMQSDEELARTVSGKIVLFGDFWPGSDRHAIKYDDGVVNDVPGCLAIADAINSLLTNSYLKPAFPLDRMTLFVMACFAVLGCLLPVQLVRSFGRETSQRRSLIQCAVLAGVVISGAAMVHTQSQPGVHISMSAAALLMAALPSLQIEFARAQRRVAPNSKRRVVVHTDRPSENLGYSRLAGK